jgi:hypothetical protein
MNAKAAELSRKKSFLPDWRAGHHSCRSHCGKRPASATTGKYSDSPTVKPMSATVYVIIRGASLPYARHPDILVCMSQGLIGLAVSSKMQDAHC